MATRAVSSFDVRNRFVAQRMRNHRKDCGVFAKIDCAFSFGTTSALFANLINNIPMSVLYSKVLESVSAQNLPAALYASVIGSNLGALLTPIGALAAIMWNAILKNKTFVSHLWTSYGAVFSLVSRPFYAQLQDLKFHCYSEGFHFLSCIFSNHVIEFSNKHNIKVYMEYSKNSIRLQET